MKVEKCSCRKRLERECTRLGVVLIKILMCFHQFNPTRIMPEVTLQKSISRPVQISQLTRTLVMDADGRLLSGKLANSISS